MWFGEEVAPQYGLYSLSNEAGYYINIICMSEMLYSHYACKCSTGENMGMVHVQNQCYV